jgi:hypothetical protein
MSELTKLLVLAVAFAAFILAAYLQEGGSWRGPHNLRKSLPAKGATIGMQQDRYPHYSPQHPLQGDEAREDDRSYSDDSNGAVNVTHVRSSPSAPARGVPRYP